MIGDVLGHPLVILIAGAFLTGWLIPRITRRWQDQRKALEIKADQIERVTSAVTEIFTATQFAQLGAESQTQEEFDEAYRTWQHDKAVLTHLIRVYFRSNALDNQWLRCRALATAYYVQVGIQDPEGRRQWLERVQYGLMATPDPIDFSDGDSPYSDLEDARPPLSGPDLTDIQVLRLEINKALEGTVRLALDTPVVIANA